MDILKDVNEAQRAAITHIEGPLLVLAGAGSGKTRVVTRRIAYFLSQGISPRNILAITFTNKAANEMAERVRQFYRFEDLWVSTFHAFSARTLRRFADRFDYPGDYSIYDTADKTRSISRILKDFELDTSQWSPSDIESTISLAKSKMVSAESFSEHAQGYRENMLARIYERYEQNLKAASAWDFDDLLLRMMELLSNFEEVREKLRRRFQFVLIDEFQDTNLPQYLIARLLGEKHRNICATGDPDQSIYAWRGANLENIFHFERDFPEVKVVRLEENYRSTKIILQAASSVISHNRLRKHKDLWTNNVQGV
ncbi:MAG: ATP-dependent DNA helicase PcrA, partial [Planctomycetes bacterium DG_23]